MRHNSSADVFSFMYTHCNALGFDGRKFWCSLSSLSDCMFCRLGAQDEQYQKPIVSTTPAHARCSDGERTLIDTCVLWLKRVVVRLNSLLDSVNDRVRRVINTRTQSGCLRFAGV